MAKIKEAPEELQREKEDIENLLASLETALSEGGITQEHYNEVKQKNSEKLAEITKSLKILERQSQRNAEKEEGQEEPAEAPVTEKSKTDKTPAKEHPKESKEDDGKQKAGGKESQGEQPATGSPKDEKPGIFGGLAKLTGERQMNPEELEEKIKEKIIMEFAPKMDKINLRLVKVKAFVDALKDDKTSERENSQRITEEVGETRSTMNTMEGRLSEMEMKLEDATETLADLKPQRFTKELQKKDDELKQHDARLEKLDDISGTILKRVNQIQIILEKLGNIESIALMTKDISQKMVSMDDKEKKISRLADKIDNMFVELNKRLEEFMFYKAKQDSLDDLSKEMLKSIDELSTKLNRYAEKDDLELLRDSLESKMNTIMKEGAAIAPMSQQAVQAAQSRSEIESLMKLLDEQFKKGQMSKKDYEKAKHANEQKLKEMSQAQAASTMSQPQLIEATPALQEWPVEPEAPSAEQEGDTGLSQAAKISEPDEEEEQEPPAESPKEPEAAKISKPAAKPKPPKPEKAEAVTPEPEKPAEPEKPKAQKDADVMAIIRKKEKAKEPESTKSESKPAKSLDKKQRMLADLDYSLRKGIISQQAYERTQKIIMAQKL